MVKRSFTQCKPSVAQTIAKVLGDTTRKDGYFQNDEYYISWCIGHLVSSVYPPAYDEKYKVWKLEDLPILPTNWKYFVSNDKKKQFGILKALMHRKDVTELVCATDSGREGELIFRLVYHQAGCTKPFERLWTSSLEDKALLNGLANLKDSSEFDTLYQSADCRDKADWLMGINLSRLLSLVYRGSLSVGRVKTPTLAMIANRAMEIRLFQATTNYSTALALDGFTVSSGKLEEQADAEILAKNCKDKMAMVQSVVAEQKTVKPPKLYDLTTLQRECNRLYSYTAQQTLDIAQALYERKIITYPRTDSRYLTEDMEATALEVVALMLSSDMFAEPIALDNPNIVPCLDSSKVSDHYAIIPTINLETTNLKALPMEQQQVFTLIAGKLLCAVSAPHVYKSTKVTVLCENTEFTATGKIIVDNGFKELERIVEKKQDGSKDKILPLLVEGQELLLSSATVQSHVTSPPKPYTEDTLLSVMERAGSEEYTENIEMKGIGTPATRAGIIEGLVKDGYVTRLKNQIIPTKTGMNLISVVPEEIRSAKLTASWEEKLHQIQQGTLLSNDFMQEIQELIVSLVANYQQSAKTVDTSLFNTQEVLGDCPRCSSGIIFSKKHKNYYCQNKDCSFALWENNKLFASLGKKITKAMVQDFLTKGETFVKAFVSKKTGKPFDCTVVIKDTGKYTNFDLKFNR